MAESKVKGRSAWADCGLLLAAHGSTSSPDGALVINRLLRTLRNRNLFAEIEAGFLFQSPHLETAIETFTAPSIYVVPVLASHGFTADSVIADRLGLRGPVTRRRIGDQERTLLFCEPVGSHAGVPALIGNRIHVVRADRGLAPEQAEILLVGHGSKRAGESAQRTRAVAAALEEAGVAPRVHAVFLEQEPLVDDWRQMVASESVLVVPFLMSSWFHGSQDLPARLGLDPNAQDMRALLVASGVAGPFPVGDHRLWYLSPVGNDPALAEVVLAVVRDFDAADRS